ncbi:NAD(P)H-binding protein [Kineosporia sp. NBRC 101731]|uniref:NAD(P)H-binding protein n=1 Tax=Kineosporia sp. NBRC 101731 TaxID=3032199 RepID=UPI0024A4C359|nr:NAD(P)H-binding protein [Kineosporia sp. NBRC 101731]GLY32369.1 epimerase [Kineosporia sp. NBRC 101731]
MSPIGVLGASGAVGAAAISALQQLGLGPLRLGARHLERLRAVKANSAELVAVDVTDAAAVRAFVRGCAVVLDCTGPSYELGEAVPVAALAEKVPCVLVTGEQPVYEALTALGDAASPVVLSAGTMPGLSGLLPRLLVQREHDSHGRAAAPARVVVAPNGTAAAHALGPGESPWGFGPDGRPAAVGPAGSHAGGGASLVVHTGGLERATRTVAADLVLSLGVSAGAANLFGEAGAAWHEGAKRSRALAPADDVEVAGFPGAVSAQPFLSLESERVARDLGLHSLRAWHVHPGPAVRSVLATLPAARHGNTPMDELIARILRAADVDLTGRAPYYRMVFTLTQPDGEQTSALVTSPDSYRLTAAVGACAVQQILDGQVPSGVQFADRALDPAKVLNDLGTADPQTRIDLVVGGAEDEEGAL